MEEELLSNYSHLEHEEERYLPDIDFDQLDQFQDARDKHRNIEDEDLSAYSDDGKGTELDHSELANQTNMSRPSSQIFDMSVVTRVNGGITQDKKSQDYNIADDLSHSDYQNHTNFQFDQHPKSDKPQNNKSIQLSSRPRNREEEEQLSDYGDEQDEELSKYQTSLFGNLDEIKSIYSTPEEKQSSHNDVKHSEATGPYTKKSEIFSKYKSQKHEKFSDNNSISYYGGDSTMVASRREKPADNKKRFSKKQLELVSRFFADYYAYETKSQYTGKKITLRQIGQKFGLGHATIHKLYAQWMDDPYFYQRIKRYDRYRKQTKNPERKLTLDRLEHITRLIKENPFLTQNELCVELNRINELKTIKCGSPVPMTRTIVGKLLKMGKFRKKRVKCVPKQKNTSKSLETRYWYCLKYKDILERRSRVYFLDQSGLNLYMTRDKAWSRPNQQITVNCPISKGKRFSLIAVIGQEGVAHWRFIEGNYRKFQYLDFIRQLFQKIKEHRPEEDADEIWIIMDNCAIHDKQQTINLAREYDLNILYLPSYSPQLNPIENWFHQIKVKLRKINYSGERQLFTIMENLLKKYQDHDFSAYFYNTLKYVEKGMRKEKF